MFSSSKLGGVLIACFVFSCFVVYLTGAADAVFTAIDHESSQELLKAGAAVLRTGAFTFMWSVIGSGVAWAIYKVVKLFRKRGNGGHSE